MTTLREYLREFFVLSILVGFLATFMGSAILLADVHPVEHPRYVENGR